MSHTLTHLLTRSHIHTHSRVHKHTHTHHSHLCTCITHTHIHTHVHTHTHSHSHIHHTDNTSEYQDILQELTGRRTVPNIFINGKSVGGCDDIIALHSSGQLAKLLLQGQQARDTADPNHSYDYDVVVIGGGSGGLACAKVSVCV